MLSRKSCEGRFEIAIGSGIHNNELEAPHARRCLQVGVGRGRQSRGRENAKHGSIGYQLAEQLQSFRRKLDL